MPALALYTWTDATQVIHALWAWPQVYPNDPAWVTSCGLEFPMDRELEDPKSVNCIMCIAYAEV